MKAREIKELRPKTLQELESLLAGKRAELTKLYLDLSLKKLKNVKAIKILRDDIARILTILSEKRQSL